jgi:mevalonate pyrophosphate decarboxylase
MAIIANTFTSFDAKGIREDLANIIYDISPDEVPLQSNIGQETVSNTYYEWMQDVLAAPDSTNQHIDGDDITAFTAVVPTVRVKLH